MLEKLYFEEGEFAKWQKHIEITNANGELKYVYGGFNYGNIFPVKQGLITDTTLFQSQIESINLNSWNNEYFASVLNGYCWTVQYKESDGISRTIHGINSYPKNYRELIKILNSKSFFAI